MKHLGKQTQLASKSPQSEVEQTPATSSAQLPENTEALIPANEKQIILRENIDKLLAEAKTKFRPTLSVDAKLSGKTVLNSLQSRTGAYQKIPNEEAVKRLERIQTASHWSSDKKISIRSLEMMS